MGRTSRHIELLETIWELPDDLWELIEPMLWEDAPPPPKKLGGRPRIDWRRAIDGIIFRLRSGCQWNKLPRRFGSDRSIQRWFQRWCRHGVFERIWAVLVSHCDELGGVDWQWQAADGMLGKARFGGEKTGENPTDRAKPGTKKSVLAEGGGRPLAAVIAGANVPDFKLLDETIRAIVVERPDPQDVPQHLSLDAGFDNAPVREVIQEHGYIGHVRPARQGPRPKRQPGRRKARRWVVERLLAWLSKCRALLVRYGKHWENFLGLIQLACGLLWYRRLYRLEAA